jgi:hypothetical protein
MEHLKATIVTADKLQIITRPYPYTVFGSKQAKFLADGKLAADY